MQSTLNMRLSFRGRERPGGRERGRGEERERERQRVRERGMTRMSKEVLKLNKRTKAKIRTDPRGPTPTLSLVD